MKDLTIKEIKSAKKKATPQFALSEAVMGILSGVQIAGNTCFIRLGRTRIEKDLQKRIDVSITRSFGRCIVLQW